VSSGSRHQLRYHVASFFSNWRESDAGFLAKVWLTLRNRTKGLVTLKGCCGHLGEPGC
jgi:hypothetical protein